MRGDAPGHHKTLILKKWPPRQENALDALPLMLPATAEPLSGMRKNPLLPSCHNLPLLLTCASYKMLPQTLSVSRQTHFRPTRRQVPTSGSAREGWQMA